MRTRTRVTGRDGYVFEFGAVLLSTESFYICTIRQPLWEPTTATVMTDVLYAAGSNMECHLTSGQDNPFDVNREPVGRRVRR